MCVFLRKKLFFDSIQLRVVFLGVVDVDLGSRFSFFLYIFTVRFYSAFNVVIVEHLALKGRGIKREREKKHIEAIQVINVR